MCGIVGAFDLRGRREFPEEKLRTMCRAIAHRGPDDEHVHLEPGIALGVRRLSIVDLAGGRQPLSNETGTVWVAFNGELFEYPELFEELRRKGHQLATRCDTELWVHLYEDYGADVFQQVKGQFGVSLWDSERRRVLLGRDRVGITPLFYAETDGWLLWSSEVKGILASGLVAPQIDVRNLDHFLTCSYSSSSHRSFFAGIHNLPPGMFLSAQDGKYELHRYWQLDYPDAGRERRVPNPETLVDEFEQILRQAVRRRLRGDVPVVTYLSGGIDSTIVTALACQESKAPLRAYTIGLTDTGKNERAEAEQTCRWLEAPITAVDMNGRMIVDEFPELIQAAEAPLVDTTCACMIRLAHQVRADGFKVTLSGEGSDEALSGYRGLGGMRQGPRTFKQRTVNLLADLLLPRIAYRDAQGSMQRVPHYGIGNARPPQQVAYELIGRNRLPLYSDRTSRALWGVSPLSELEQLPPRYGRWHPLHQGLYLDYHVFLQGHLLSTKGDRTAMNGSIEARPPFLDEDVVQFCSQLAPEYRVQEPTRKWLLRKMAERWLPPEISHRPKHGFRASFAKLFLAPGHPEWVDQLLSAEALQSAGIFDPAAVAKCRKKVEFAERLGLYRPALDMALAAVISTQLWQHTFCGGGLADLPTWTIPRLDDAAFIPKSQTAATA